MKKIFLLTALIAATASVSFAKDGVHLEFKITSPNMSGTSSVYEADGNTRSEMTMQSTQMKTPMNVVTLFLASTPAASYTLNEKDKTYTETDISKTDQSDDDYEVSVVGKESVNGYSCTHVIVTYKKFHRKSDMWLSKDIPGYARMMSVKTPQLGGARFFNKLKEKGADGFVARMKTDNDRGGAMQMDLVKAEQKNVDALLFSLNGYTKSTTPGVMNREQLMKMTPEERQQYLQQMRDKYKK